jgi:hypothetical protein
VIKAKRVKQVLKAPQVRRGLQAQELKDKRVRLALKVLRVLRASKVKKVIQEPQAQQAQQAQQGLKVL